MHGGSRANAGRKKGSKTKRRAVIVQAEAQGLDPADVLQEAMERYHKAKDWDKAVEVAALLMPYRHSRKSAERPADDADSFQLRITEIVVTSRQQADAILATNTLPRLAPAGNAAAGSVPG